MGDANGRAYQVLAGDRQVVGVDATVVVQIGARTGFSGEKRVTIPPAGVVDEGAAVRLVGEPLLAALPMVVCRLNDRSPLPAVSASWRL